MSSIPFLMWYDDSPKRTIHQKISDAQDAFIRRFGQAPTVAMVNPLDLNESVSGNVLVRPTIGRYTVWVGIEERTEG